MRGRHQALAFIALLLVLLSPAAAWTGWEADSGATASQHNPHAVAKRMLLQSNICLDSKNQKACTTSGFFHSRTTSCIANVQCSSGTVAPVHTVLQAAGSPPVIGSCPSPDHQVIIPSGWRMVVKADLAPGVVEYDMGVWLSADGFSPSSIGAGCFIFGLPTSGSCYHNVGNDACGDFQGSQATDDAVVCTTPGFFVPCLASRTGKLQVPWCVTYSMSSQASCQVVGPFTTANPDNRCYCGDTVFDDVPVTAAAPALKVTVAQPIVQKTFFEDEITVLRVVVQNTGIVTVVVNTVALSEALRVAAFQPFTLYPGQSVEVAFKYTLTLAALEAGIKTFSPSASGKWIPWHAAQQALTPSTPAVVTPVAATFTFDARRGLSLLQQLDKIVFSETGEIRRFTVTVMNTGSISLRDVRVINSLTSVASSLACTAETTGASLGHPVSILAPNAKMICRGSHAVTAADITSGFVQNTASVSATGLAPADTPPADTLQAVLEALALQATFHQGGANPPATYAAPVIMCAHCMRQIHLDVAHLQQFIVYTVQFTILQDSLDVNEVISITPEVVAKGPLDYDTLTGNQLSTDTWTLQASQQHALAVTVVPLVVGIPPQAGDEVPVRFTVKNSGNVRLQHDTFSVTVGSTGAVTLGPGDCKIKSPSSILAIGQDAQLECAFDHTITQDDIESSADLTATVAVTRFYYTCPAQTTACRQSVTHSDSKSVWLEKVVRLSKEVTTGDPTYSSPGGQVADLDHGSITRSLHFTGTAAQSISPGNVVFDAKDVRYDARAFVNVLPTITPITTDAFKSVDWKSTLEFSPATDKSAAVAADQQPLVEIWQTSSPATLTLAPASVTVSVKFVNTGNVGMVDFVGLAKTGETQRCSTGPPTALASEEVAECRYTVDITDQAAFETGISHQAQLSGKYSKDGDDIAYTKGPEPFTLTATPDPKVSLDLTTCETASAPGTATCTATVVNTGNWRLNNLVFSSSTGADVSSCSTAELSPGDSRQCDVEVAIAQADLDTATDISGTKEVRVAVSADVLGQNSGPVTGDDSDAVALVVNHSLDVVVAATPATLLPMSGLKSTVAVTLKNTGNVVLKWDAVNLRKVGTAGTYPLADCSKPNGLVPGGEVQCSFVVDNTLEQCNSWPTFSFEVSLTYTAAAISTGFARTGSSNTVTCKTCVVNECPSPLLVESELKKAFSWECDCKTKTITVNFNSPFRRGNCEDTPVSRIFLFTDAVTDAAKSLAPRCQQTGNSNLPWHCQGRNLHGLQQAGATRKLQMCCHHHYAHQISAVRVMWMWPLQPHMQEPALPRCEGGVSKGGIARLPEVKPGQLISVLLSDPTYKSKNALFGPSENLMLMSGPTANALFKSTKSNCNVGVGNGVTACGTYTSSYVVPAGASCGAPPTACANNLVQIWPHVQILCVLGLGMAGLVGVWYVTQCMVSPVSVLVTGRLKMQVCGYTSKPSSCLGLVAVLVG
ncbi:hypothetical protein COO60DRAFT_1466040 [Scenedesmus sp. NREL 46B-D3]|nr:hypothetical protein COO60DRAFT_1466040 [Scenedesmus sp. NREL 46B-D3]